MTNNPTIDGVSRELLRKQFEEKNEHRGWFVPGGIADTDTPEGFVYSDFTTDMCWTCYFEAKSSDAPAVERQPIKNASEVAYNLQAENARLEARITQLESEKEFAAATYQAARDRIEELESGRGEIAGFRYRANGDWEWMDESPFADGRTHYKLGGEELQPLFTAPPAPASVVLPERRESPPLGPAFYARGWNACLDATAALNGPAK